MSAPYISSPCRFTSLVTQSALPVASLAPQFSSPTPSPSLGWWCTGQGTEQSCSKQLRIFLFSSCSHPTGGTSAHLLPITASKKLVPFLGGDRESWWLHTQVLTNSSSLGEQMDDRPLISGPKAFVLVTQIPQVQQQCSWRGCSSASEARGLWLRCYWFAWMNTEIWDPAVEPAGTGSLTPVQGLSVGHWDHAISLVMILWG